MDISEVARRSGLPASTLRYYEERGLIRSIGRDGLKRRFAPDVLDQLGLIALGRASGFSLDEIASMFSVDKRLDVDRALLASRADDIERTVRRLVALGRGLRHAAKCPAPSHMECPTFRRLVRAAAAGALQPVPTPPASASRGSGRSSPRSRSRAVPAARRSCP
jgi:DNA-binding transcriptional MerR regulator